MKERNLLYFALGVMTVVSLGALSFSETGITFADGTVQTTAASADPRRVFYLTNSTHYGDQARGACASNFHMASMWEILDVSNLRYATNAEGSNDVQANSRQRAGSALERLRLGPNRVYLGGRVGSRAGQLLQLELDRECHLWNCGRIRV